VQRFPFCGRGPRVTIEPGSLLADRYRVVRVLGRGGMGLVAEARNVVTDKRVAVKALHEEVARDPEMSQRLLREATAACRIRHPNVVDVYDVIRDGASIVLVMELLEGESLRALLDRGRPAQDELLAILIPAMHGVAEAHRQGVIHRDVHPGNIFLANESNGSRTPQVLDFGISKIGGDEQVSLAQGSPQNLTRSGMTMGTPLYMSYEQLMSARDVDVRTDVYSFGVVLYEGLTGQVPYDGDSFAAIAMQIVSGTPVPPRELNPQLPRELERVVLRAMARNREDRIASIDALIRELTPFVKARELPSTVPSRLVETRAMTGRRIDTQGRTRTPFAQSSPVIPALEPARKRALMLGMAAGTAVALVGALLLLSGKKPHPERPVAPPAAAVVPSLPTLPVVEAPALAAVPDAGFERAVGSDVGLPRGLQPPSKSSPSRVRTRANTLARPQDLPAPQPEDRGPAFRAGRARREDF
jgi:serine/threonine protein kinase